MAKRRKGADHRADTRGSALSGLPHVVADSLAYLSLDPFERAVLAEILRRFNGYNNGSIGVTYEEIEQRLKGRNRCRPNNRRIARAVARLVDHGLIGEPEPHSWMERRSREYRLTFVTSGKAPPFRAATNDYLRWSPARAKIIGYSPSPREGESGDERRHCGKGVRNVALIAQGEEPPGDAEIVIELVPVAPPRRGPDDRILQ